jgi:hypothetical protein
MPRQPLGEHPGHDRRGRRVRLEPVRAAAPGGVRLIGVRAGVAQPVPVRRAAAQVPVLFPGLGSHRGPDPDPGPGDLPLGLQPQREHQLLVILPRSRPGRPLASRASLRNE